MFCTQLTEHHTPFYSMQGTLLENKSPARNLSPTLSHSIPGQDEPNIHTVYKFFLHLNEQYSIDNLN